MSNRLTCIKPNCGNVYITEESEAYYCEKCLEEKEKIAKEVDKKMAGRVNTPIKTDLQNYEELLGSNGIRKGGITVVNAKDLGLL